MRPRAAAAALLLLLSLRGAEAQGGGAAVTRGSVYMLRLYYESLAKAATEAARQTLVMSASRGAAAVTSRAVGASGSATPRAVQNVVPLLENGVAKPGVTPQAAESLAALVGRGGTAARPVPFEPEPAYLRILERQGGVIVKPAVVGEGGKIIEPAVTVMPRMLTMEVLNTMAPQAGAGVPGMGGVIWQNVMTNPAARKAAAEVMVKNMPWLHPPRAIYRARSPSTSPSWRCAPPPP